VGLWSFKTLAVRREKKHLTFLGWGTIVYVLTEDGRICTPISVFDIARTGACGNAGSRCFGSSPSKSL